MSLRQHALGVTALGQLLASCALPAVTSPTTPALPAAASAAPPAAADPSRAPAEPLPGAAATSLPAASSTALPLAQRLRLTGQVRIGKTAVARARLTLFDLATGAALVAKPWNEAPSLRLQAGQALFSDDAGAFDLELPPLAPDQVIKLVASLDGRTFVTLLAPVTAAPAGPTRSALPYALTQDPAGNLGAQVTLSPEDTAVAKTFEGVFKLILLQAPADRSAALGRALSAARQAVAELQGSLSGRSELAAMLLASVGSAGEIVDRDQFRTALARAGAFGTLNRAVQSQLGGLRGGRLDPLANHAPITVADFPLDPPDITADGQLSLAGLPLPFTLGPGGFQPSPSRGGGSRAQPTPPPPPGPQVFRLLVGLPGEARGLAAYDETTYVVAIDQRMRSFTSLLAGVDHTLGASGEDCYAVAADPANARVFVGRTNSLWQCPMPHGSGTPQQIITGLTSCGLAIGRQDLYVSNHDLATSQNSVARISLASTAIVADVQVGGAPYNPPGSHFCHGLAIDDATATPTLYLGTLEGEVYSVQDGGATHTILASGLGAVMGMVFSPANRTLYLTSIADDRVYALNVDTLATATVTLDQPFTTNHGPWGITLSRDGRTLSVTEAMPPS